MPQKYYPEQKFPKFPEAIFICYKIRIEKTALTESSITPI